LRSILITNIGLMRESSLHAELKRLYSNTNAKHEFTVCGFIVDIIQDDSIIEIQTGSFSKIKNKLSSLLQDYKVKLVYPIAYEKTLIVYDYKKETILYKRRSPKRGGLIDIVDEIIHITKLVTHPNFSLEVVLTNEEEIRTADGKGSWRRRGVSIVDRKLVDIIDRIKFLQVQDYLRLLPSNFQSCFTNRNISDIMNKSIRKVQKLTYSLKQMGLLQVVGKQGNAHVFKIVNC
jgi:hypothetical protein